ncbi:MAG: shikimate dehydrogenase [Chloroflexi bacterium]|nr:shikimate dehydrogenase [Chloroflexota bacterium]
MQLGLVGYPLEHSLSPAIHTTALRACGLDGTYSLFPISAEDLQELKFLLDRVRNREIAGLNVTIPHKLNVIPLLDELSSLALAVGAVNTIYLKDGRLFGHNTDVQGFLNDLNRFKGDWDQHKDSYKSALVLGAGGSARAVLHALVMDGWRVTLAARRLEQAREIASRLEHVNSVELSPRLPLIQNLRLVVNTTPVGMDPAREDSPWPQGLPLPNAAFYDLVYNPRETKFLQDARKAGLPAVTGKGMLIEQAALAFEIWTGRCPPRAALWEAVTGLEF